MDALDETFFSRVEPALLGVERGRAYFPDTRQSTSASTPCSSSRRARQGVPRFSKRLRNFVQAPQPWPRAGCSHLRQPSFERVESTSVRTLLKGTQPTIVKQGHSRTGTP